MPVTIQPATLRYKNGEGEYQSADCIKGDKGDRGETGATGETGAAGVSPTVSVSEITGGHQVVVTDGTGDHSFDVMDGVPDPEDIAEAVTDWLDENVPTGQTVVVDSSLSIAGAAADSKKTGDEVYNLKSAINDKAPSIIAESGKAFNHVSPTGFKKIKFYGSELGFDTAHYATKKRYLSGRTRAWTSNGVNLSMSGCFVIMNGTATATDTTIAFEEGFDTPLPAGTYKLVARMSGTAVSPSSCRFRVYVKYSGDSSYSSAYSEWVGGASFEATFTVTNSVTNIRLYVGTVKDYAYNNYVIWANVYPSDTTIVDTGETVQTGSEYEYNSTAIENLEMVDTMVHESSVDYVADTKTYIDEHTPDIIGYWNDNVYAIPEKFGAVGDGVEDDTTAVANCIAYSASSGKPVRGYGKYKISSTLLINTRYQDVYLRYLVYTGNNAAVQISERYITFGFDIIESSATGILFQRYGNQACQSHKVSGVSIVSTGDCIRANDRTYYITVDIRNLSSSNANCINCDFTDDGENSSEYIFRDCSFSCPTGWAAYKPFGCKFYSCTVEGNCKNGYFNPINCSFFGCRHREFNDASVRRIFDGDTSKDNGALFKYTVCPTYHGIHGLKYITADSLPWFSIDVSEIQGYGEIEYDGDESAAEWHKCAYNGQDIGTAIRNTNVHGFEIIGEKAYFIGGNKVFAPGSRTTCVFDKAEYDMTLFDGSSDEDILAAHNQGGWGTDFITGYSHTDYYMNASFGAVGYNDLTITQENGNTCTIYDKLGNVLFDGTNEGDGKWSLKCVIDRYSMGRLKNAPNYMPESWWCYDGTNEIWEITKLV